MTSDDRTLNISIYTFEYSDHSLVYVNGRFHTHTNHWDPLEWLAEHFTGWTIGQIAYRGVLTDAYWELHGRNTDSWPENESDIPADARSEDNL